MRKFSVIVTRDTTESCFLYFEAESVEQAHELALERAERMPLSGWGRDDCATSAPYITEVDEAGCVAQGDTSEEALKNAE